MQTWDKLDDLMSQFSPRLREDLGLTPPASNHLASTIAGEVRSLPHAVLHKIQDEDVVGLKRRIEELVAFEAFMDFAHKHQTQTSKYAPLTRAEVVCQLYVVFVYLGEACFIRLRKEAVSGSVLKKCCKYLTDFPVRGFRNAIAHSNWHYTDDFAGILFHYFEDKEQTKQKNYTVSQLELNFWDMLARVTAYAAFQTINELA